MVRGSRLECASNSVFKGEQVAVERQDKHFDGMADKFERSMYGASRGQLRLSLLQACIARDWPKEPQPVLDIGAGLGHMAEWAADRGHAVTLVEPSLDMLERARIRMKGREAGAYQANLQHVAEVAPGPWPRILCHAVLEWMAEPYAAIPLLARQLAPGGWLSLMVYNRDGLIMSNVVKGNLARVQKGELAGRGTRQRLTPISPLCHDRVVAALEAEGLAVHRVTGIRIFHDYLRERHPDEETLTQLFELEQRYAETEPFWRLGRYLHYSVHKPS